MIMGDLSKLALVHSHPDRLAFIPHGHCYLWQPGLVWLHGVSDGLIALAYLSIPAALLYLVSRRRDLPYPWMFQLFGIFIIACGLTHLMEIWTLWHPIYWVAGALKAMTAFLSLLTAIELIPLLPEILTLPSRYELEAAKVELEQQVRDRTESLRLSEERWQLALRGNNDGIWDWNLRTNDVFFSSRWKEMLGFADHEIRNHLDEWSKRVHPEDLNWVTATIQDHLAGKTPFYVSEHRVQCKDGTYKWILDRGQAIWDEAGQAIRMTGSHTDITERKQAVAALEKELLRSKTFLTTSIDGIVVLNRQGNVVQASPSFAQMLGYTDDDLLQLNVADWDGQWTRADLQPFLQGVIPLPPRFETCHRRRDGSCYDVEISYSQVELDGDRLHFCICRDISDRKRNEAERQRTAELLRLNQARFQAFMNHSPACAWITDDQGRVLYTSQTYMNTFQLPTPDLVGHSIFDLYPPDVAQQFLRNIQIVAQTGQIVEAIEFAPRQDGTMGDFWVYKFPVPDESGATLVGGVALDVTLQHRAEEELRHQKEMFQAIVDHIPVMVALFNESGDVEFINPELEQVLGWTMADWQQRDILTEAYPDPAYRQMVLDHMLVATGSWQDITTLNARGQVLETSWANVRLSGGRFLGIGQDISDRKQKEAALRQAMEVAESANLAKSMFLANMSHELRTPLNVILGFTQVMAHDPSLTPSQHSDLQTIRRSGDHLLNLINDVLDLSKIEAGHYTLTETAFDLISLLHTLRTMMAERAQAKQLQFSVDIAPDVPQFILADEQKLRQILLNLLSNAIKFTTQGEVTLRVWVGADATGRVRIERSPFAPVLLQFAITDTGVGIAPEEQGTIFDAFVQAEAGKKSVSGTGLGLTISHRLVDLMQGTLVVQSSPNVGSTFTCTIPVHPTSGVEPLRGPGDRLVVGLLPGQVHRRILVADDQQENRQLMVRLLSPLGLEVREASDGQEAVQLWQDWQPDLTWMDIRMPGLDGYEATRQIRAIEPTSASIIIALTAQASQSDRTLALAAGCNDYISKPFQSSTVFLKLAEYLGLEYRYAEPGSTTDPSVTAADRAGGDSAGELLADSPALLRLCTMSQAWLGELEEAAACGNDRAISTLVSQLPSDLAGTAHELIDLANQFKFEQILDLLHTHCPTGSY